MATTTPHDLPAVPPASPPPAVAPEVLEQVAVSGDLLGLTAAQRLAYYRAVCQSLGLNPLTKPFEYLTLNGKLKLYALRDCADQLRAPARHLDRHHQPGAPGRRLRGHGPRAE